MKIQKYKHIRHQKMFTIEHRKEHSHNPELSRVDRSCKNWIGNMI